MATVSIKGLKGENVDSTRNLLLATRSSTSLRFVYMCVLGVMQ